MARELRGLSKPLLIAPILLVVVLATLAQPVYAQATNTTTNTTAEDDAKRLWGLLVALERMYDITQRFLERTGIPSNSSLWQELEEIGQKIDTLRQMLENGTIEDPGEVAREYSKLFREMAEIIVKAAYWKIEEREEVREVAKDLLELIHEERKLMFAISIAEKRIERLVNMSEKLNCTLPINYTELLDRLNEVKTNVSQLLNETKETLDMLRAGNITPDEAEQVVEEIEYRLDILEEEVEELLEIKYPFYYIIMCRVAPILEDHIEKIEEYIDELEELAEKLQNTTGEVPPGLEKLLEELEEKKAVLEKLLEKLQSGNLTPLEALYVFRMRQMMPDIEDIIEAHIERMKEMYEHYEEIEEEEEYGRNMTGLPDILPLLPEELQELLVNASREVREAHRTYIEYLKGNATKEDVQRELAEARTALEKAREGLEAFLERRKGMWRMIERYLDRLERVIERIEEGLEEKTPLPPPEKPPHRGVLRALMKVEATLERLEEIADRLDKELVEEKLDKAQDYVEDAREHLQEGEVQKAVKELKEAKSILEEVLEIIGDDEELVEHMVNTIKELIDIIDRVISLLES